jgi:hypothetical protein
VRWLPPTVPPLLARAALTRPAGIPGGEGTPGGEGIPGGAPHPGRWTLEWVGQRLECSLSDASADGCTILVDRSDSGGDTGGGSGEHTCGGPVACTRWRFLRYSYFPDAAAWEAYGQVRPAFRRAIQLTPDLPLPLHLLPAAASCTPPHSFHPSSLPARATLTNPFLPPFPKHAARCLPPPSLFPTFPLAAHAS